MDAAPITDQRNAYHELCAYTLSLRDAEFTHQHVVDAYTAQYADASTKPIAIVFALVGLYLHVERGFTGKEVQREHMRLAKVKRTWPAITLPRERGTITAVDVLASADRKKAIDAWCASVWSAYRRHADAERSEAEATRARGPSASLRSTSG